MKGINMEKNLYSEEANGAINALVDGWLTAIEKVKNVKNKEERENLDNILNKLKEELVSYFGDHVDRRKKKREKILFEDMLGYYSKFYSTFPYAK